MFVGELIIASALLLSAILLYISRGLKRERKEDNTVRFTKLNDEAKLPTVGSKYAAGADLYSLDECVIPSRGKTRIPTGVAVSLPSSTFMKIESRSGLALKHNLDAGAGVVDYDYSGEIGIIMKNFGSEPYCVNKHDKIAQGVIHKVVCPMVIEEALEVRETERGYNGFGSTGKK